MTSVERVKGVGPYLAAGLAGQGIDTAEALAVAATADIAAIPGIGDARAARLILAAKALLATAPVEEKGARQGGTASATEAAPKKDKKSKKKAKKKKEKSKKSKRSDSEKQKKKKKKSKKGKKK